MKSREARVFVDFADHQLKEIFGQSPIAEKIIRTPIQSLLVVPRYYYDRLKSIHHLNSYHTALSTPGDRMNMFCVMSRKRVLTILSCDEKMVLTIFSCDEKMVLTIFSCDEKMVLTIFSCDEKMVRCIPGTSGPELRVLRFKERKWPLSQDQGSAEKQRSRRR